MTSDARAVLSSTDPVSGNSTSAITTSISLSASAERFDEMMQGLALRLENAGHDAFDTEAETPAVLIAPSVDDQPLSPSPNACGALGGLWKDVARLGVRGALALYAQEAAECAMHASEVIRKEWRTADYIVGPIPPGAPHGEQAVHRNAAVGFASGLATGAGAEVYVIQQSLVDQMNGHAGSTMPYWATDWKAQCRVDLMPPLPLFVLVDVDFHLDMTKFLGENFSSVLIYTFVPEAAGRADAGYSFHFNDDQTVTYSNDARTFNHLLWDWTGDTITVEYRGSFSLFRLDRRHLTQDRMLLLLTPIKRWEGVWSKVAQWLTPGWSLERFKPVRNGWAVIRSRTNEADLISLAQVGSPLAATLSVTSFEACRLEAQRAEKQGHHLTKPQVLSHLPRGGDTQVLQGTATVLSLFLQQRGGLTAKQTPAGVAFSQPTRLQPQTRASLVLYEPLAGYDGPSLASMVAYAKPLIMLPCVPAKCLGNEVRAAKGRVTDLTNLNKKCHPKLLQLMNFVLRKLIPDAEAYRGHPVEISEVMARQPRPTQRRIIKTSEFEGQNPDTTTRVFMKREAYTNTKDARLISQITGSVKVEYSQFCYAFGDGVMCGQPFVACSMSPVAIADRVADICSLEPGVTGALEADVTRFDGHENYPMRKLFEGAMYRYFAPEHHVDLGRLLRQQHTQRAVTTAGHRYATGPARLSGSPETTIANTLENSFIVFCTIVRALRCDLEEGWSQLCSSALVLGDDSIQGVCASADWVAAAVWAGERCGHVIVANTHWPHGPTLPCFLSRMFCPGVYWGERDSMSCLTRAVSKVHLCTVLAPGPNGKLAKLVEKAWSGRCMDAETPILGSFYRRVFELASRHHSKLLKSVEVAVTRDPKACSDLSWWARQHGSNNATWWPNSNATGWMHAVCEEELADFDMDSFHMWLDSCNTLEDLLDAPLLWSGNQDDVLTKEPKEDTVINDGEVLLANHKQALEHRRLPEIASSGDDSAPVSVQIHGAPLGSDRSADSVSTTSGCSGTSRHRRKHRARGKKT